jgi:N-terminal domain of anti-restriction factor ArdC
MSTNPSRKARRYHTMSADERRAQRDALNARLAAYEAETADAIKAEVIATLDGYSPRNAMLIAAQLPGATECRGFVAWKEQGRAVRKGEHGAKIVAFKGEDTSTGADGEDETHQHFGLTTVFDISQTDLVVAS